MKKSLLFYKIFMPLTLGLTVVALTFSIQSLLITFDMNIGNIKVSHPLAILFIVFISLSLIAPIVLSILAKETKIITRTKNSSTFHKIAIIILIAALACVTVFDSVILVKELIKLSSALARDAKLTLFEGLSQYFEAARLLRMILSIPFIAYLVFELTGNKSKSTFATRAFCNSMAILWCAITPVVFYFFNGSPPITEYMHITYSIAFIFIAIFFLYDFKWNYLETSFRIYSPITTITAIYSLVISIASIIAVIARRDSLIITNFWDYLGGATDFRYGIFDIHAVNLFEIILLLAFGVFALSKVILNLQTFICVLKSSGEGKAK